MAIDEKGVFIPGSTWSPIDGIQQDIFFKNMNRLILIVGNPRSGKSLVANKIGELVNPARFNAKTLPNFLSMGSAQRFMEICNADYTQPGDVILFDEAGIGASSRTWFSEFNKALNFLMQIFGFKRFCVIFTVPRSKMIDNAIRSVFSDIISTMRIDRATKLNHVRWMKVVTDDIYGRTMYHYFRHDRLIYTTIKLGLPTKDLLKAYMDLEAQMKPKVMVKLSKQLDKSILESKTNSDTMKQVVGVLKSVTGNYQRYCTFDKSGRISGIDKLKLKQDFSMDKVVMDKVESALGKELANIQDKNMIDKEVLKNATARVVI